MHRLILMRQLPGWGCPPWSIPGWGELIRPLFWRILPVPVPDLTAHLAALADTARPKAQKPDFVPLCWNWNILSVTPSRRRCPPSAMHWFEDTVGAWKERREKSWKQLYSYTSDGEHRCFYCLTA